MQTLIDVESLQESLSSGEPITILDVRWALGDPHGYQHYLDGHIPGGVYVDLERELASPGAPEQGRHPLPDPDDFQEAARRWGIDDGGVVVAYDDNGSMSAARLWWLLRDAGREQVYLLDGGLGAWKQAGCPVETGSTTAEPGSVRLTSGRMPSISMAEAGSFPGSGLLLDARAGERYRGEAEPVDPRAGHIPGATSAPTSDNLTADGRFKPATELRERFEMLRADGISSDGEAPVGGGTGVQAEAGTGGRGDRQAVTVAVYCGSGISAAHEIVALEIAGIAGALYPGSWSQWSNHPQLPVATGAE
ncbi:sulfurtransferase [Arthrobacter sp. H14]|uniref:sulfurtransferase n=1 Tax=Arthrobacter sp. H14 TaxID=1312959 RepID=UPI00047957CD|nr:sulfurtransferase [Arthrobacter sp. H14]